MPDAWRIVPEHRATGAFEGEGARLYGGRWNSPGRAAVYVAESRALAALEVLVHLTPAAAHRRFVLIRIRLPRDRIAEPDFSVPRVATLSAQTDPRTQRAGDAWLAAGAAPALKVPSAVIPAESNYLLNPRHPGFADLATGEPELFAFDPRLMADGGPD